MGAILIQGGALTQIATPNRSGTSSNGTSLARAIKGRSKCYRQLSELKNLRDTCVLTDAEFETEREAILTTLGNLKTKNVNHSWCAQLLL